MTATARKCIDSDTQVMTPRRADRKAICGNCGSTVDTYIGPVEGNEIPFIARHTFAANR